MPKRTSIIPHLTIDQLEQHYRHITDRTHSYYQIIWLLVQGRPTEEVVAETSHSRD